MSARQSHTVRASMNSLHTPHTPSPLHSPVTPVSEETQPVQGRSRQQDQPLPEPPSQPPSVPQSRVASPVPTITRSSGMDFPAFNRFSLMLARGSAPRDAERERDRESVAASWAVSARSLATPSQSRVASPTPGPQSGRNSPFVFVQDEGYGYACNTGAVFIEEMDDRSDEFFPPGVQVQVRGSGSGSRTSGKERELRAPLPLPKPLLSPPLSPPVSPPAPPSPYESGPSSPAVPRSGAVKLREDDPNLLYVDKGLYVEEDQSDAPWASYKPTIRPGSIHGMIPEDDSVSLLRSKMYEILDDKSYTQQQYFLQCEYGKLPSRPHIPVTLDGEHSSKAQVLFGIGHHASVPAIFWSSSQYFVRAVYSLASAHALAPAIIYAHTARIRRDMTYLGAFVGWLPLDFGVWRGKQDLDPERAKYMDETFPGVDDAWAFWYPVWSKDVLTKRQGRG